MILRHMLLGLAALSVTVLPLTAGPASAQAKYPNKSVHWIVGYVPGGTTDILARLIGQYLSEKTGQQFVIENKAGAGNNLAVEAVLAAPADGYTLLLVNPANGINTTLYKKLSFNFVKDIAPVGGLMRVPNVMVVNNNVPAKTVKEFIDHVKANPGKVNMASSGNGTSVHMSGELFMEMTGAKMTHVPYRGSNPALTDIMGGQVQVLFDNMPSSIELIKGGKIRALAVTTEKRASYFPDLPTVAETVPGYEASAWFGMGVKAGTPPDVIATLNKLIEEALADPKMKEKIAGLGGAPMGGTPEDFGKIIVSETAKWKKVVEFSGASVE
jgi:tripartite-type tricarboxylate transporter receptor subunit TctC